MFYGMFISQIQIQTYELDYMSVKPTNFTPNQSALPSEILPHPSELPLPPKTPQKRHIPEPNGSIFTILSPLPFPPKIDTRTSDPFFVPFPEMQEVATPLPKESSRFMVEGEKDAIDFAIGGRIIFESEGEDPNSYSDQEESSQLQEEASPSKNSSLEQNSENSEHRAMYDEADKKEENRWRKPTKSRGNTGHEGTPSGKRVQCNCRKSKCLKLYCDCFRLNLTCDGCNCVGCHNLETFAEERNNAIMALMDRNPDPFGVKIEDHKHVKGCNCKKSGCQKKYCECYQAGLPCGDNCKCEDCKNLPHEKHDQSHERTAVRSTAKKERRMLEI